MRKTIDEFIETWLEFDILLREKKGLNEDVFSKLKKLLYEIEIEISNNSDIPKSLAMIFIDIYSATESNSYLYQGADKQKILEAADILAQYARSICASYALSK